MEYEEWCKSTQYYHKLKRPDKSYLVELLILRLITFIPPHEYLNSPFHKRPAQQDRVGCNLPSTRSLFG